MTHLFDPLQIRAVTFKNRIGVSPMCQYSAEDGFANDWHLVHLGSRAVGGAGMVMVEATAVTPEGRISPGDLGIWQDAHLEPLKRIALFIEAQGSVPAIQIAHAGRKASAQVPWEGGHSVCVSNGGWPVVAPSAIPFADGWSTPKALELSEIKQIRQAFIEATCRALEAGFKVLEIHAAHGYLLHEFLSPLSNHRTDAYGGSFENRIRLVKEVVQEVRQVWPAHLPLWIRISASDWVEEGGWDLEQSVALAKEIKALGIDCVDISSGGLVSDAVIPVKPGYQVPFAAKIREEAEIATAAVGMITDATQANDIIQQGEADMVLLARELLRDPYWPLHVANQLGADISWPKQYQRAKPRSFSRK